MMRVVLPRRRALAAMGGALATPMLASGIARAAGRLADKIGASTSTCSRPAARTDMLSRIVCQELSELTGQQFIVENKGGSGGNVGADAIAKSAPDGYTVGLYSIASHADLADALRQAAVRRREGLHADQHAVVGAQHLVVKLDLPVKTVPELVALVKASPGKYTFASGGSGTSPHSAARC